MAGKGEPRNTIGPRRTRLRVPAGACAAALAFALTAAHAQVASPRPDNAVRAAPGVVVNYQEVRGANVLYLEEKGGRISAPQAPVAVEREPSKAEKARRSAPRKNGNAESLP
jgi:hypothetical protein